jgi:hypothetical protein
MKRLQDELTVAASSSSTSVAEVLSRMQEINNLRAEKASFAGMVKGLKAESDALQLRCDGQVQVHTNFLAEAELRFSEQQSKIGEQQTTNDVQSSKLQLQVQSSGSESSTRVAELGRHVDLLKDEIAAMKLVQDDQLSSHQVELAFTQAEVETSRFELEKLKLESRSAGVPGCAGWESHAEASLLKNIKKKVDKLENDRDAVAQKMEDIIDGRNAERAKVLEETLDEHTFKVNDLFTELEVCELQLALKTEELEQYEDEVEEDDAADDVKSVMTFRIGTPPFSALACWCYC